MSKNSLNYGNLFSAPQPQAVNCDMAKPPNSDTYPRQLSVSMEPSYWRALNRLRAKTGTGPGTYAKQALHMYLYENDPIFRREQETEAGAETEENVNEGTRSDWKLNDAP